MAELFGIFERKRLGSISYEVGIRYYLLNFLPDFENMGKLNLDIKIRFLQLCTFSFFYDI